MEVVILCSNISKINQKGTSQKNKPRLYLNKLLMLSNIYIRWILPIAILRLKIFCWISIWSWRLLILGLVLLVCTSLVNLVSSSSNKNINSYCGTPTYMAPEVVSKVPHNPLLSDRWSLGILLFNMLNGHCPFRATTQK